MKVQQDSETGGSFVHISVTASWGFLFMLMLAISVVIAVYEGSWEF